MRRTMSAYRSMARFVSASLRIPHSLPRDGRPHQRLSVLQEAPFTDQGSVVEIFTDLTLWAGIKRAIDQINANTAV